MGALMDLPGPALTPDRCHDVRSRAAKDGFSVQAPRHGDATYGMKTKEFADVGLSLLASSLRAATVALLATALTLSSLIAPLVPTRSVEAAEAPDLAVPIEPTSAWAKTNRDAMLWSGWDNAAIKFSEIPANTPLQVIELRGNRAFVYFSGDKKGHPAGNVWIDRASITDLTWPRWARARQATALHADADLSADVVVSLPRGSYVETTGIPRGRWSQAFFLADGTPDSWSVGWVDGLDLALPRGDQAQMSTYLLTQNQLTSGRPDVWLRVPYHSQLDGTDYADANCGPTSVAMALEAYGLSDSQSRIREAALKLQDMDDCDDCGTFIQVLASVVEGRGLRTFGLRDNPDTFHRWTIDEVRRQVQDGHVVIPQVKFRMLPGRLDSPYYGDHYIVISGISGSSFLYNDPVDSDGRGYGRLITAAQLDKAMDAAHDEFSRAAFAVGR